MDSAHALGEPVPFGARLERAFEKYGQLCVGIDPHAYLLEFWGVQNSADGAREFGLRVVDAAVGKVGIIKPQVAFFERFGADGLAALEVVLSAARATDLLVIGDAKRGDLGSTMDGYAEAWLTAGSPLEVDALTVATYMGVGSLLPAITAAQATGKGLFLLAATSNPEGFGIQTAKISSGEHVGVSVASSIVTDVSEFNTAQGMTGVALGSLGVVLGATVDFGAFGIDLESMSVAPATPILAPGFGYQGAEFSDLPKLYGPAAAATVVSASRSILQSGPAGIHDAISRQAAEVARCRE